MSDPPITNTTARSDGNAGSKRSRVNGKAIREEKRKKWQAKQELRQHQDNRTTERLVWIQSHSHFCTWITDKDQSNKWLKPYVRLQEKQSDGLFIAEGAEAVRLLIRQCRHSSHLPILQVQSIFVKPTVLLEEPTKLWTEIQQVSTKPSPESPSQPPFHVLIGEEQVMSSIAGYPISRGALACGVVPRLDESWLDAYLENKQQLRLLALDAVSDTANLGSILRCASAFGIDAVLLSRDCCDAWYRRSIRVSMGHVFRLPIVRLDDLARTIEKLKSRIRFYAAVIDVDAECVLETMEQESVPSSWCCVVGNEANGISKDVVKACNFRIRIDMVEGVDSLSVPIATGILLHGLRERESTTH